MSSLFAIMTEATCGEACWEDKPMINFISIETIATTNDTQKDSIIKDCLDRMQFEATDAAQTIYEERAGMNRTTYFRITEQRRRAAVMQLIARYRTLKGI